MSKIILAVTLPILVLAGWCIELQWTATHGRSIRLSVEGFDPRDLLTGHYVNFRLALGANNPCLESPVEDPCVCFAPGESHPPAHDELGTATWAGTCVSSPSECPVLLRGGCENSRFVAGVERYYIPEELGPVLQRVPQNSSIVVHVAQNGTAEVNEFLVGEERLEDYAHRMLAERPAPPVQ